MVYLKQGIGLKEAQELVEEKAKAKYEEYFADGKHRASCKQKLVINWL